MAHATTKKPGSKPRKPKASTKVQKKPVEVKTGTEDIGTRGVSKEDRNPTSSDAGVDQQLSTRKRRPKGSIYTPALGKAICKMLASGMSLNEVCKRRHMPYEQTVRGWARDPEHPFSANYVRAREVGYLKMADDILEIADDSTNDYVERENKDGSKYTAVDHDHIARSRLRVDTRKWLLSKALPKVFGDKVFAEHTGKDGGPIQPLDERPRETGPDHLAALAARYAGAVRVVEGGKLQGGTHAAHSVSETALNEAAARWVSRHRDN